MQNVDASEIEWSCDANHAEDADGEAHAAGHSRVEHDDF
jgi:hypothetical protein